MDPVDSVLAHYGKKGMKWGVTTIAKPTPVLVKTVPGKRIATKGGTKQPAHVDAILAVAARQKAKASTIDSLSNVELNAAVTRMNLEQRYAKLTTELSTISRGKAFVNTFKSEVVTFGKGDKGPVLRQIDQLLTPNDGGKHRK